VIQYSQLNENLDSVGVFKEDPLSFTRGQSKYFKILNLPSTITTGKQMFLIQGTEFLKTGVEIKIELKDSDGNIIYTEPIDASFSADEYKPISIVVYGGEVAGTATITILAELSTYENDKGLIVDIPTEWRDIYNVRWQDTILLDNSTIVNKQPIYFYEAPTLDIEEVRSPYVTISGSISDNTYTYASGTLTLIGDAVTANSYEISTGVFEEAKFSSSFIGGVLTVDAHDITGSYNGITSEFTSSITNIISETKLKIDPPFTQRANLPNYLAGQGDSVPDTHNAGVRGYTITYVSASYQETQNNISFAKLKLNNLKTYSGDVHSIKTYMKASSGVQELLIGDGVLEEEKLFIKEVTSDNVFFDVSVGDFINQAHIDENFTASLHTDSLNVYAGSLVSTQPTMSYVTTPLMDGLKISGSLGGWRDFYKIQYTSSIDFNEAQVYKLRMKLHGNKLSETRVNSTGTEVEVQRGKINIYMSGSAFIDNDENTKFEKADTDTINTNIISDAIMRGGNYSGHRIYATKIDDVLTEEEIDVDVDFIPDSSGSGTVVFYVESGEWTLKDLEINSSKETGFNPEQYTFYLPLDKAITDDTLTFYIEFFNINNEPALLYGDTMRVSTTPINFTGSNQLISGDDNLLSGKMFVGRNTGTGVEIAGVSSAYIRSVGYDGFLKASNKTSAPGWMMWSGSVLSDSGDNYSGVGLELHAGGDSGSFKFRTDTNELAIRTDTFFVGKEDQQFISGADRNIEISSSLFHLDPTNETLVIGAGTTINANLSANEIYVPAGTDAIDAVAYISSSGFAMFSSASIAGWNVTSSKIEKNNVALDSTLASMTVTDINDNIMIKVGSGSLSEVTGSGTNLMTNPTFDDTGSGWYFTSASDGDNAGTDQWPTSDFIGTESCSMEVTSSNSVDVTGQHIRIFIPAEQTSGGA